MNSHQRKKARKMAEEAKSGREAERTQAHLEAALAVSEAKIADLESRIDDLVRHHQAFADDTVKMAERSADEHSLEKRKLLSEKSSALTQLAVLEMAVNTAHKEIEHLNGHVVDLAAKNGDLIRQISWLQAELEKRDKRLKALEDDSVDKLRRRLRNKSEELDKANDRIRDLMKQLTDEKAGFYFSRALDEARARIRELESRLGIKRELVQERTP